MEHEHKYREYRIGRLVLVRCEVCKEPKPDYWKKFKGISNPGSFGCDGHCGKELPLACEISVGYPGVGMQFFLEGKALAICNSCGNYHCEKCCGCDNHGGYE